MRLKSIAAVAAVAPLLIGASEPLRLQPSSPWVVDYAESSCRLVRTFGAGQSEVKLSFESDVPDRMDMLASGMPLRTYHDWVPAHFGPAPAPRIQGNYATTVTSTPAILWSSVDMLPDGFLKSLAKARAARGKEVDGRPAARNPGELSAIRAQRKEFASGIQEVTIEPRPGRAVILETGPLGDAIAVFETCSRDSLRDWGVDPDLEDKIVKPVWTSDPSRWFSSTDYPAALLDLGAQSDVKVRLLVDATGHVTSCTSLSHFDRVEFNRITCEAFKKRAVFEPAELADGTRVPSYYVTTVVFRVE